MADAFMRMQFEAQRSDYQRRHPASRCQVIEANGRPAGRLWLAQDARGISVLDITLRQAMRGRGIASECLRRVQRQAAAAELEVRLQVVNGNPAQRLYERLGFRSVGRGDVRQAMAWQTAAAAAPP
jgi:ribosomal protein S18 acetylase RimI-like enzyme